MIPTWLAALLVCTLSATQAFAAAEPRRTIPQPLPSHPGNIFLNGEQVSVTLTNANPGAWQLREYHGRIVLQGKVASSPLPLGKLPTGYYELALEGTNRVTGTIPIGVIDRLRVATPVTSPIGIDVAMAWLYPPDKMPAVANLCALAGMNRVRERLSWPEMEPQRGKLVSSNKYDFSIQAQFAAGLKILDVNHMSPAWANPVAKRFPLDLRDAYNFYREVARRWQGQIAAFEPWNEADIDMFGGHTGSEMAAMQKASYLGLKAGNPGLTVSWNVFAIHRATTLRDMRDNEAWPYFDTYNLHHYEPFENYPKVYADHRACSAGRPLWVSECSVPSKWSGDQNLKELSAEEMRVQAERLVKTYALSLHEGTRAMFYFMLPHYVEGPTQYGILHPDLTPRPAFVALAAVGRLLADAVPLGRLTNCVPEAKTALHGYLFNTKADGRKAVVLVAWSDQDTRWSLPAEPRSCFDVLGRSLPDQGKVLHLTHAPQFVLLRNTRGLDVVAPPATPKWLPGTASPVVLQAAFRPETLVLKDSAYNLETEQGTTVPLFIYNFGSEPVAGALRASTPASWTVDLPGNIEVVPGERKQVPLQLKRTTASTNRIDTISIRGAFGRAGTPVISFRLTRTPTASK